MCDNLFEEGMRIKRDLRLLAKTLRNTTLISAAEYIDKLEVRVITVEGEINNLESRGISKPISEILHDFKKPKPKTATTLHKSENKITDPKIEKKLLPDEIRHLGDKVIEAFIILVKESRDWGGEPCVGTSDARSLLRGALPHLKKAGLLKTIVKQDGSQRGTGTYVQFSILGKLMAIKIEELLDLIDPA